MTSYNNGSGLSPADLEQSRVILPIVLQHLTPTAIAFIGLGAISAAVMSSVDATLLSAASMFTKNVYNGIFRKKVSDKELVWVLRLSIVLCAIGATALALTIKSVYVLWYLCSDFVYVLLFPQLLSVIYLDPNAYGSICGLLVGTVLRIGGGEILLDWSPFIHYLGGENFPYKSFTMLISFTIINLVSLVAKQLFVHNIIPEKYDYFQYKFTSNERIKTKKECRIHHIDGSTAAHSPELESTSM